MKIRMAAEARREMYRTASRYDKLGLGLGNDFLSEIADAFAKLREFPHAWPSIGGSYRKFQLSRFPYLVVFETRKDDIRIVAIGHTSRGPRYWRAAMRRRD